MTAVLNTSLDELNQADVEPPTCQWEHYPSYRSGQPVEGCDDGALPGTRFCARHLSREDRR